MLTPPTTFKRLRHDVMRSVGGTVVAIRSGEPAYAVSAALPAHNTNAAAVETDWC